MCAIQNDECAGNQFNERDECPDKPERPGRQERVAERQKIFSRVFERAELKDVHDAGHEEDEAENEAGKQ